MYTKQQIVVIHGGSTFDNQEEYFHFIDSFVVNLDRLRYQKDWKDNLQEDLGSLCDVFQPRMPNSTNAQYSEWKKILDKIIEKLNDNIIFVGHSLGALFLVKYFSENYPTKKIKSLFLVAAPFDDQSVESLGSFIIDPKQINNIEKRVGSIFLYYSKDDFVVPVTEADKYKQKLPNATVRILEDRGHFKQEKFLEIVTDLQNTF